MKTYGQYCPIARTSELFAERWTPLIVRNLLAGCRTFGELLAGAPGISRALLAQRLSILERNGIVTKTTTGSGRVRTHYELTQKGQELRAVTEAMGAWGARWLELEPHHTDPIYVLWATSKLADVSLLPPGGLTVRVDLRDRPRQPFWLLLREPKAEVCTAYPGVEEDLILTTDSETLARWHLRHITPDEATANGQLALIGTSRNRRLFLKCMRPSPYAHIQPAPTHAYARHRA